MRQEQSKDLVEMGFNPTDYKEMSDKEMDDFLEIIAHEPLVALSICCGAEIDEDGFCTICREHAV